MSEIKIIGLTGLMGAGKTSLSNLLDNDNKFKIIRLGEFLRNNINKEDKSIGGLEYEADMVRKAKKSIGMMFLNDIKKAAVEDKIIIIDSIRTAEDIKFFNSITMNFKIVMILADERKRFERIISRKRNFDPSNISELRGHDVWEMDFGIKYIFPMVNKFLINESMDKCYQEFEYYLTEELLEYV